MKRQLKIAVVVTSRYRKYSEVCLDIFNKFFNYEDVDIKVTADFFVHTHEKVCDMNLDKTNFSHDLLTEQQYNEINTILSPKKIVVETNYDKIKEKVESYKNNNWLTWCTDERYCNDFHRLYQYHSFEEGIKLVDIYERENNFLYDLVFKVRPDLYIKQDFTYGRVFKHPFDWESTYIELTHPDAIWAKPYRLSNTIFVNDLSFVYGYPKICDTSFFGSSESIKKFTNNFTKQILENMISIYSDYQNNPELMNCFLTPETTIVHHLKKNTLILMPIPYSTFSSTAIRPNYIAGSDFDKVCELFYQYWQGERNRLSK